MNRLRAIILIIAVGVGVWVTRSPYQAPESGAGGVEREPSPLPRRVILGRFDGLAVQVQSSRNAAETYGRLIHEVAEMGSSCVLLSVNGYQERVESTLIRTRPDECPPDDVWLRLFDTAHAAGLKVALMPKILLSRPHGKWRGKIQPTSWDAWFAEYRTFVLRFARLAEAGGVELFIIGSELVSTEQHTERWQALIADVRSVFGGLLGYSANWDHYAGIRFWGDLDVIGLTTYHKLADTPGPSPDDLRAAWKPIRDRILSWRRTVDRPLLFTEVGWCSQEGCSVEPWNYYHKEEATAAGHEEQRRNYQAFIDSWAGEPDVAGMIWWEWNTAAGGPDDFGYTPRGKPAEAVLRRFLGDR